MPQLALHFLGSPYLLLNGEKITLSHQKAIALLAYLAVTRQRQTRSTLADLLWTDYGASEARAGLRRMIWVINHSLGREWLEADNQTVLLPARPNLWLDVAEFRALLATRHQHAHPAHELCAICMTNLTKAVDLAQGDFLAGYSLPDSPEFDTWQRFETESLRQELAAALAALVQGLVQGVATSLEQAISYARRWLALDPLHEPAQRQLMQLYAWSGQIGAAIQQYQSCVQLLQREIGMLPSAETTALFEEIKANRLRPPPEPALATAAALTATTATTAATMPPHNLPLPATPFIGREETLSSLQERLATPEVRLITIAGPGGIGKTRLSLAIAEQQLQETTVFVDGVYFIPLAHIQTADLLVQAMAESLSFPLASTEEPLTQFLTYLRHKRLLLVLDNFEQLLAGAEVVGQMLQTAEHLKILVTSRERLNLAAENVWSIGGLDFSQLSDVETALADEAVQLFMQQARRILPHFSLQADDLPHLARILRGVWGMPLAIELAAAWLNMLSLADIAAELGQGLDLLESSLRDAPDRHRSMRLVFDYSWQRLTAEEQALFKALAVFRDGFTRDAARQVAGASLPGLAGLVNRSLLVSQPHTGRYALHELLRQYAQEKLELDPAAKTAVQQTHATYYANLMQQSWADFSTVHHMGAKIALEQDMENIRLAYQYWLDRKNCSELLKFMDSFWLIYEIRGWYQIAIIMFEEAITMASLLTEDDHLVLLVRGKALAFVGYFVSILGQPQRGLILGQEALALLDSLNQPQALMSVFFSLIITYLYLEQYEQTLAVVQEVNTLAETVDHVWLPGGSLTYKATALLKLGKVAEAQQVSDEVLQKHTEGLGNYIGLVWAALVRGQAALMQGNYAEAKPFFERCIELAQRLNYRRPLQQAYDNLGEAAFYLAEFEQAEQCFQRSLEISEEIDQTREMLGAVCDLARVWAAQDTKKAGAVELTAVILHHPLRHLTPILRIEQVTFGEAAERLRASLETELEPNVYQAAWQQAKSMSLETAVAGLLR